MEETSDNRSIKKVFPKSIIIVLGVVLLLAISIAVGVFIIIPTNKYKKAVDMMNLGQYEEALSVLSEISESRDVVNEIRECYYRIGEQMEKRQSYKLAYDNYTRASGFSDAQQKAYAMAEKLFSESLDEGDFAAANNWVDYLDPSELKSAKAYLSALKLEAEDQVFDAIDIYKSIPKNYRDASSRMLNLCGIAYESILLIEETSLLEAEKLYKQLPSEFTDASVRLNTLSRYLDILGNYELKVCANTDTAFEYRNTDNNDTFNIDGYLKNGTFYVVLPTLFSDGKESGNVSAKWSENTLTVNYGINNTSSVQEEAYYIDGVWVIIQKTDITYKNPNNSVGGSLWYLFTSGWNEFIGSTYYEAWAKGNENYEYALSSLGLR